MGSSMVCDKLIELFRVGRARRKTGECAEMAKITRTIKIRDKLRVRLFTPTGRVYQTITKLTQPLDQKIEWRSCDYDIELVAGDPRMYELYRRRSHSESR